MELRPMRYAVMVAQHENFRHAAEHLPISQSALSQQIKKLEDELGEDLFERHSTGVSVTATGERFLQKAQGVLERAEEARSVVEDDEERISGTVSVGLMPSVPPGMVSALLEDVEEHDRDVHLKVQEGQPEYLLNQVKLGNLDHLVVSGSLEDSDLSVEELLIEPFRMVVPSEYFPSGTSTCSREDLEGLPLLVLEEGHSHRRRTLTAAGEPEPRVSLRSSNVRRLVDLVEAGHGYAVLPESIAQQYSGTCDLVGFREEAPERAIVTATRESRPDSPLDDWFRRQLREWRDGLESD